MKPVTKIQIALFSGSILLIVLLLFANITLPEKTEQAQTSEHSDNTGSSIETLVSTLKATLTKEQSQAAEKLEKEYTSASDKNSALRELTNHWSMVLKQPVVAAYYTEQAAIANPIEQNWLDAANRYYAAARFAKETEKAAVTNKAIECFEKAIALNPANVEAKVSLAACFVESPDPMKGIGMLREIEKTDSNNVNLQLNFAFFSERSGQFDKAIKRFEKVLKLQPDFIEAYLHLADAYERMGNKQKAIESLEKYISLVDDKTVKNEIEEYINKLSQGNSFGEKQQK